MLSSPAHYRAGSVACYARLLSSARIASFSSSSGASSFLSTRSNCRARHTPDAWAESVQHGARPSPNTHLVDEQEEMAVARVQMRCRSRRQTLHPAFRFRAKRRMRPTFDSKRADVIKVVAVEVRVYPEQPAEECAHSITEISREWYAWKDISYVYDRSDGMRVGGMSSNRIFFGWERKEKGAPHSPICIGKIRSSSRMPCAQFMSASTYSGAGSFEGRLYLTPSSQRYSYLV